ncbi:SHOCT domain-containing protein, partial [bacterium]|nr:SHOCT domain-containing protein [bacterium]
MKKLFLVTVVFLCLLSVNAFAEKVPETKEPIDVTGRGYSNIAANKVTIALNSMVIEVYDGILKVLQNQIVNGGEINDPNVVNRYLSTVNDELKSAGYSVPSSEKDVCRFQIRIKIVNANVRIFLPNAGNYIRSLMTVNWDLFDSWQNKTVYSKETKGYKSSRGQDVNSIFVCFANSCKNLLAEKAFVSAVETASKLDRRNEQVSSDSYGDSPQPSFNYIAETRKLQEMKSNGQISADEFQRRRDDLSKAILARPQEKKEQVSQKKPSTAIESIPSPKPLVENSNTETVNAGKRFILKTKETFIGEVLSFENGVYKVKTAHGVISLKDSDIDAITKNSVGVPAADINDSVKNETQQNLCSLRVTLGISYNVGGFQAEVGQTVSLIKGTANIRSSVYQELNKYGSTSMERVKFFMRSRETENITYRFVKPTSYVSSSEILAEKITNSNGEAVFKNLEKGTYVIWSSLKNRQGIPHVWAETIECTEKENTLLLSNHNAIPM